MNEREEKEREREQRALKLGVVLERLSDGLHYEDEQNAMDFSIDGDTIKKRVEYRSAWLADENTPVEAGTVIIRKGDAVIAELLSPFLLDIFSSKGYGKEVSDEPNLSKLPKGLLDRMDQIENLIQKTLVEYMAEGNTYHNAIQFAATSVKNRVVSNDIRRVLSIGDPGFVPYSLDDLSDLTEEQPLSPVKNTFKRIIDKILGRDKENSQEKEI